ncbi:MAG: hypothetical protein PHI79_08415 [Sulfurovaceae bacterium]|nr:hypothetical protein [Sulfurovaceae bacterium]MDD5549599.1 hypothetical protein [Sulfurovaceae bacterium]
MTTQIPICRALIAGTENDYLVGMLSKHQHIVMNQLKSEWYEITDFYKNKREIIDESTLAIHFPTMLASDSNRLLPNGEKDLRIFASLSEDGNGGDTLFHALECEIYVTIFNNAKGLRLYEFLDNRKIRNQIFGSISNFKITGIQE